MTSTALIWVESVETIAEIWQEYDELIAREYRRHRAAMDDARSRRDEAIDEIQRLFDFRRWQERIEHDRRVENIVEERERRRGRL